MSWRTWPRRLLPYVIAAAAGFLLAYLIVAFFIFPAGIVPDETKVPNVIGMALEDAQSTLGRSGFKGAVGEQRFNNVAPRNVVLQQTPPAGSIEQEGTTITLDVSRGQRTAEVPTLMGVMRDQARLAIENAGLEVGAITERSSDEPRGEVIESRPRSGDRVTVPSAVDLVISSGPATIEVPDLTGRSLPEARRMLDQLGLRLGRVTVDSLAIDLAGTVTKQEPRAGRTVSSNAMISVTIAGREP